MAVKNHTGERKKNMKKLVKIGFCLSLTALFCSGCISPYRLPQNNSSTGNSTSRGWGSGNAGGSGNSVYSDDVEEKVDYINELIDEKFYFEASDNDEREEYIYKGILESLDDPYSVYYT